MKGLWSTHKKTKKPLGARLIEEIFLRSWWVYAFLLICFLTFKPILAHLDKEHHRLLNSLTELENSKNELVKIQYSLQLQL